MGLTEGKSEWSRRSCYDDDIIPLTGRHKSTIATDMGDHSPSTLRRTRPTDASRASSSPPPASGRGGFEARPLRGLGLITHPPGNAQRRAQSPVDRCLVATWPRATPRKSQGALGARSCGSQCRSTWTQASLQRRTNHPARPYLQLTYRIAKPCPIPVHKTTGGDQTN